MSGFSADWLALREPADHRSRNAELAGRVGTRFAGQDVTRIVDLGSGTGSNLRATAPLLGNRQEWTLVDYDAGLLETAAKVLSGWADEARAIGDDLVLVKGEATIGVKFRVVDLNRDLDTVLAGKPDLVTASALFDLISEAWMKRFASALKAAGSAFYTVLTYNGQDQFIPEHPFDFGVTRAFAMHQRRDKGFGPAAGPEAAAALVAALRHEGYAVDTGDSPWILKPSDAELVRELLKGIAKAVEETGFIVDKGLADWLFYRDAMCDQKGSRMMTGHTDIFATLPA
ncbi:class I SAM-dependent methyltransferase [Rhabdaerophilum sp. SD176]|uniref:class I SAM-dependent methyltransferase n=1 Tax=Rhabdaerophilum sp. SD176 TaxID=2983548 RepID=UPI0024E0354F|nr:class I SAM-dependent methyltransferase [Rhabdaerophilum sp. SD176]